MEIGKKDVIGFVNSLMYDNHKHRHSQNNTHFKSEKYNGGKASSQIQLDRVRSKAMQLDDEIKEYQNLITNYQMQLEFLKEIGEHDGWHEQLRKFLKEVISFKKDKFTSNVPTKITFEDYKRELQEKMHAYRSKLGKGEVQLQNIFASGLLAEPELNKELADIKYATNTEGLFKNLQRNTVHNLLS